MRDMPCPPRTTALAAFAALACGGSAAGDDSTNEGSSGFQSDDDGSDPSRPTFSDDGHSSHPGGDDTGGDSGTRTTLASVGEADDGGSDPSDASGGTSADSGEPPQDPLADMGEVELVANGFAFAEGPVWVPELGALLFTDIPSDSILSLDPSTGSITTFSSGTGAFANGLDLDDAGNLLVAEGGLRRVTRRSMAGGTDVLADLWSGDPFNSPNDVASHPSGSIVFTDPTYGTNPDLGGSPPVLDFQGVYHRSPEGVVTLVDAGLEQPNGVVVSPDGTTMYVVDTVTSDVFAYPLAADGTPGTGEFCFDVGSGGDGMTIDADGNLYVATTTGVQVWRPGDASQWGTIALPSGDPPTNCAFGDDDLSVLYITLPSALYRVHLAVPGLAGAS